MMSLNSWGFGKFLMSRRFRLPLEDRYHLSQGTEFHQQNFQFYQKGLPDILPDGSGVRLRPDFDSFVSIKSYIISQNFIILRQPLTRLEGCHCLVMIHLKKSYHLLVLIKLTTPFSWKKSYTTIRLHVPLYYAFIHRKSLKVGFFRRDFIRKNEPT